MTREEMIKIEKHLAENGICAEVYKAEHDDEVCVEINDGDWKHEHLRCDYLMEQMDYMFLDSKVTEEDGSDTYSAIRTYFKMNDAMKEVAKMMAGRFE